MKSLFVILALLTVPKLALAQELSSSQTEKGFFSIGVFGGLDQSRMLNTDGSWAGYKSSMYGLNLDVKIWDSGHGDIRLFGEIDFSSGSGTSEADYKIKSSNTLYGFKVYAGSNFFLAAGMGSTQASLTAADSDDVSLKYPVTGMGLGADFNISGSWSMGLQGWYKSGPIKQRENLDLHENSFSEGSQIRLNLIWSPPSMTLNFSK